MLATGLGNSPGPVTRDLPTPHPRRRGGAPTGMLAALRVLGASLFFGDSMITPAISVLSAVEGVVLTAELLPEAAALHRA
jgi:K+ potassium transporter